MAENATDPPREAILVAQQLGTTAERLTGIKLVPGEWVDDDDLPPGWRVAATEDITFRDDEGITQRRLTRYDTPAGPVASVRHEGGEEIFAVLGGAADVIGVLGGISAVVGAVKKRRAYWREKGVKTRRRTYTESGRERASTELDDDTPLADQITPPSGSTETAG